MSASLPHPTTIRTTQAKETLACLRLAITNQDATQLKMAAYSAKATITA